MNEIPAGSTVLDYLRHAWKNPDKGPDGMNHIDESRKNEIVLYGNRVADSLPEFPIQIGFHGPEIRTKETLDLLLQGAHQPVPRKEVGEIGEEAFSYGHIFTPPVVAKMKSGRKDYMTLLIEEHGLEAVRGWALYGLAGVFMMFRRIHMCRRGLAVGHSPEFTMLAVWAAMGFPPIDRLPNQGTNLTELTGGRFVLTPDRKLYVEPLNLHA